MVCDPRVFLCLESDIMHCTAGARATRDGISCTVAGTALVSSHLCVTGGLKFKAQVLCGRDASSVGID